MLEIKNITKIYETAGFKQVALDNVSMNFRENEFVSILGPSGSGKTTLLNIIGGLDRYDSGDLVINEVSTKKYTDRNWDSYRNHRIGFVFQSYNLINHQTILKNVELALTLSGVDKTSRTRLAKEALKEVGLEKHINKKPSELSGGQMQRVAIARALVNNPDILLADEPTGALDSETSVQIMNLLKKVAKNKLVIMVTHNPELAEKYSTRIIKLKDGKVISDTKPYDGKIDTSISEKEKQSKSKKTSMSFITALGLSFNNLMTKKARTILIAFAGSIGIIGIALILAVSTGFQNYIDSIEEDTLSSYPLTISQESTDMTSLILGLTSTDGENDGTNIVSEEQYISKTFASIKTNDLESFSNYINKNYDKISSDVKNISYSYSIDPLIYTKDETGSIVKVNPNNMFTSIYGSSALSSYSSMASVYSQINSDNDTINESYDILSGRLPESYDEMVIVLSEPNKISDLLVYSLGLKDYKELTEMISKIMAGESVTEISDPITLTYDDLLSIKLKLILPTDTYKYNNKYDVYEDMSEDEDYMKKVYDKALELKIVGVLSPKEGTTTSVLSAGVNYTKDLISYIINTEEKTDIVQKQLNNKEIDVFSNKSFDSENDTSLDFSSMISIDKNTLQSAFGFNIDNDKLQSISTEAISNMLNSISTDTSKANDSIISTFNLLSSNLANEIDENFDINNLDTFIDNFINEDGSINLLNNLVSTYYMPLDSLKTIYSGLLKGFVPVYLSINDLETAQNTYLENATVVGAIDSTAKILSECYMKMMITNNAGSLVSSITKTVASSFNVDESKIASAFKFNLSEEELTRIISSMTSNDTKTLSSNLISLGYQDLDKPTYISFYFNSFDSKENFLSFIDEYNNNVDDDKKINYTDTTGILMGSVKTIVNAVSYVLIAFVSISLVVSSIMIGVITYISVYERTKEIGILRSIGASKGNISSIFNAETFIIGLLSGIIGIGITYIDIPIINKILHHFTGSIPLSASLDITDGLKLILLSVILTIIGGLIPAKKASLKNPVEALRTE